jgi:hypothetical protein
VRIRLLVAIILTAYGISAQEPDFRKVTWGMTQAQVISAEAAQPAEVRESGGEVVVKYERGDRLIYIFVSDKLVRAKYLPAAEHSELNEFIVDFNAAEAPLTEKFGKPGVDRAIWDNDAFQQERLPYLDQDRALASDILASDRHAGLSVSMGYLKLYTQRANARTKIVHALTGENQRIFHQIEYRSVDLEKLEQQVLRQDAPGAR